MELSEDTRNFWGCIAQNEYIQTLKSYTHLKENVRPYVELQRIHRLNELCFFIKGRSLNSQIKINQASKMLSKEVMLPEVRYSFYDFENKVFTEQRFQEILKIVNDFLNSKSKNEIFEVK